MDKMEMDNMVQKIVAPYSARFDRAFNEYQMAKKYGNAKEIEQTRAEYRCAGDVEFAVAEAIAEFKNAIMAKGVAN